MNNITELLERNAREWGNDVALVEIDTPDDGKHKTWREAELVESVPDRSYREEMTWREFDEKSNRFANLLLSRGFKKGDKIAILLMNCLEWLPIYFGVLNDSGVMKIDEFKDTYIKGTVEIGKDEMLYTSINFDEGWNVFVDGQKVGPEDIYKLGGALIGVEMPEGSHTVEFKFKAKGLTPGIAVSSVTALAVIAWFVYKRKKQ